ncbi:hypothetical protein RFM26_07735 [Mesorhizobium sp. VK23B]|uniref:Uncharacterized protein n=2 Tax=Mesorhizobium dulcispinae TaxID=3072316 RepID=A0ABU4XDK2_9HYPH|nr:MULTISPECIES: hypothetical protein [unclassified Mesorhizobium]MDX8465574.1 hypothetical protein [Mesorhizobium sp. VK23B]MDX8471624.1 hypothetical protein [Mesorhizobium sp. VK23A]MDX8518959.1 hypothetical protein [Mesorhizobium sp. VK23D]
MENTATSEKLGLPEDEYDNYLIQVMRLVVDGASPRQISDYLGKVENEYLMLSSPSGSKDDFVNAVFELAKRSAAR